jgi:hypothetical protein
MGYLEEIARWRMQRAQQQVANRVGQIADEYRAVVRERDQALAEGDADTAEFRDNDAIQLEREYLQYVPPQAPQWDPRDLEFLHKKKAFRERHGQAADNAIRQAHLYATAPRQSNSGVNSGHGMGLKPNTPAYYRRMNDLLEMYSKDLGLHYDPGEETLTATEAAKISGVSANTYNHAARRFKR